MLLREHLGARRPGVEQLGERLVFFDRSETEPLRERGDDAARSDTHRDRRGTNATTEWHRGPGTGRAHTDPIRSADPAHAE